MCVCVCKSIEGKIHLSSRRWKRERGLAVWRLSIVSELPIARWLSFPPVLVCFTPFAGFFGGDCGFLRGHRNRAGVVRHEHSPVPAPHRHTLTQTIKRQWKTAPIERSRANKQPTPENQPHRQLCAIFSRWRYAVTQSSWSENLVNFFWIVVYVIIRGRVSVVTSSLLVCLEADAEVFVVK